MRSRSQSSRAEFWGQVLVRQRSSGLSIHRFCAKEGLATATFFVWKRRLSQESGSGAPAVSFTPVRVAVQDASEAAEGTIEILLPQDRRVRIRGTVDRQQLAAVLAVLAG